MNNPKCKNSFAVTITLEPLFCALNSTELQYEKSYPILDTALKSLAALEYSIHTELTKEKNIHYHIFIRMETRITCEMLKLKLLTELYSDNNYCIFGFASVKKCYDMEGWLNYLKKQPYINNNNYMF